ncbi:hypothetical protein BC832DRAFT_589732 [Gaertneriomyces semiglobifer]|nr:hypothetical protein BC832DRAFT_589732 [Gaertneriomyces semiglobifer]
MPPVLRYTPDHLVLLRAVEIARKVSYDPAGDWSVVTYPSHITILDSSGFIRFSSLCSPAPAPSHSSLSLFQSDSAGSRAFSAADQEDLQQSDTTFHQPSYFTPTLPLHLLDALLSAILSPLSSTSTPYLLPCRPRTLSFSPSHIPNATIETLHHLLGELEMGIIIAPVWEDEWRKWGNVEMRWRCGDLDTKEETIREELKTSCEESMKDGEVDVISKGEPRRHRRDRGCWGIILALFVKVPVLGWVMRSMVRGRVTADLRD